MLWKLGLYVSLADWRIDLQVFVISTFLESYTAYLKKNLGVGESFQIASIFQLFQAPI